MVRRRRRWPSIELVLAQRFVFAYTSFCVTSVTTVGSNNARVMSAHCHVRSTIALKQFWFNVGPASTPLARHYTTITSQFCLLGSRLGCVAFSTKYVLTLEINICMYGCHVINALDIYLANLKRLVILLSAMLV